MNQIDYFNGVSNQDFIDYYKEDLYSRMEITLYTYPHEFIEEDPRPLDHLNRCEVILFEYLYSTYESANYERRLALQNQELELQDISEQQKAAPIEIDPAPEETPEERTQRLALEQQQRNDIVDAKMNELTPLLDEVIDEYLEKVKLNFINL